MARKKVKKSKPVAKPKQSFSLNNLSRNWQYTLSLGLLFVIIVAYFSPIVFQGKEPASTDIIAWKGNANSIIEARKEYGYTPFWANNVFSGMPSHLISLKPPFEQPARYIINGLNALFNWRVVYFFLGAIGMFLLMRFWNYTMATGFVTGLAFIWWPHLIGLLEAGHNSKVQTIMLMPFILLTFLRLLKKVNLLNIVLFTIAFGMGFRAGHYQIMFYASLVLAFFGIDHFVQLARQKDFKGIGLKTFFIMCALFVAVTMSAFSTMMVQEYSKSSIRGGTGEKDSSGLSMDYATSWSLHPGEMFNFLMPRFYGGDSSERYQGTDAPRLKGQTIPGYWGHMPFTSSTDYLGVVTLFLAALALFFQRQQRRTIILGLLVIFSLLLAFGRHFPILYKVFFSYMPFFDKFRVPTMIIIIVHFSFAMLAGIGFDYIIRLFEDKESLKKVVKGTSILFFVFLAIGLVPFLLKNLFAFARPDELSRYNPEVLALIKTARYEFMRQDAFRMLLFSSGIFVVIFAALKRWINRPFFVMAVVVLLLLDLFGINNRYMDNLMGKDQLDRYFTEMPVDQFIKKDPQPHRIFPVGNVGQNTSHWSYHHESIEGYHPAKLRIYQDLREFCLYKGTDPGFQNDARLPINWNIVNMLNTKYIVAQGLIKHPDLKPIYTDQQNQISVFENQAVLPRAFCLGQTEVIPDRKTRFARLNESSFDPAKTAILEKECLSPIEEPSEWKTEVSRYEPNFVTIDVETDKQCLLVLSEIYYTGGWNAFVNGQETDILKTDHVLRGVIVPAGKSTVEFRLEPKAFYPSMWIMGISIALVYILLIVALIPYVQRYQLKTT